MKKTKDFTEGKIFMPLIQFALPVFLAMFLQSMYGASLFMIGLATPSSTLVQIVIMLSYFLWLEKKAKKRAAE